MRLLREGEWELYRDSVVEVGCDDKVIIRETRTGQCVVVRGVFVVECEHDTNNEVVLMHLDSWALGCCINGLCRCLLRDDCLQTKHDWPLKQRNHRLAADSVLIRLFL